MAFLKKIISAVFGDSAPDASTSEFRDPDGIYLYVKCNRCGAPVRVRADKRHDLQQDYDTGEWVLSKEIMDGGCFSLIQTNTRFDARYRIIDQLIEGGEFITAETYRELAAPTLNRDDPTETAPPQP